MNDKIIAKIDGKFPKTHVKMRKMRAGKYVNYVTGSRVIRRLNSIFGHEWSFTVIDKIVDVKNDQIAVLGRLTVYIDKVRKNTVVTEREEGTVVTNTTNEVMDEIIKEQWGSAVVQRYNGNNSIVELGNDIKAATTDSLKKCASLLGVGIYLYDEDEYTFEYDEDFIKEDEEKEGKDKKSRKGGNSKKSNEASEVKQLASKAQIVTIEKVLKTKEKTVKDLLSFLDIGSLEELSNEEAGQIIILKHKFWRG